MRITIIAPLLLLAVLVMSSCRTGEITEADRLSPSEYQKLVAICRKRAIIGAKAQGRVLSPNDIRIIQKTQPKFTAYYYGSKKGKFRMWWRLDENRLIRVIGDGAMLDPNCPMCVFAVFCMKGADDPWKCVRPPAGTRTRQKKGK